MSLIYRKVPSKLCTEIKSVIATTQYKITLFNDNINTFDHVITCLVKILNFSNEQATQCTWICHHKGKYDIKVGEYRELRRMCRYLIQQGLSCSVRNVKDSHL